MWGLTPPERRALLTVALILLAGAGWDGWRASRPPRFSQRPAAPVALPPASAIVPPAPREAPLQLNLANARQLDALPGIGPVLAERIVRHRSEHGGFRDLDELRAVRGIGPALLQRLRPLVAVDSL